MRLLAGPASQTLCWACFWRCCCFCWRTSECCTFADDPADATERIARGSFGSAILPRSELFPRWPPLALSGAFPTPPNLTLVPGRVFDREVTPKRFPRTGDGIGASASGDDHSSFDISWIGDSFLGLVGQSGVPVRPAVPGGMVKLLFTEQINLIRRSDLATQWSLGLPDLY